MQYVYKSDPGFSNVCEAAPRLNDPEMRFGFSFILIGKSNNDTYYMAESFCHVIGQFAVRNLL